jgi:hypothetical protein
VARSVVKGIDTLACTGDFDADLIGQAKRYLTCIFQPTLAHTVLLRTRVAGDASTLAVHFNRGFAERTGNGDGSISLQTEFGNDDTFAAHNHGISDTPLPKVRAQPTNSQHDRE